VTRASELNITISNNFFKHGEYEVTVNHCTLMHAHDSQLTDKVANALTSGQITHFSLPHLMLKYVCAGKIFNL